MSINLIVWKARKKVDQVNTEEAELSIGRTPDNDLQLEDREVSKYHAKIKRGVFHYTIHDLESHNGTLVNGHRIKKKTGLHRGDHIAIGPYQLHFNPHMKEGFEAVSKRGKKLVILECIAGPEKNLNYRDNKHTVQFGTHENSDVLMTRDPGVSSRHAKISQEGNHFFITDQKSKTGTFLNKIKITKHTLASGDILRIGNSLFIFKVINSN